MRFSLLALLGVAMVCASCTENKPPAANAPAGRLVPQGAPTPVRASASAAKSADALSGMPTPPKDAQWTIECTQFSGMNHVDDARRARASLIHSTGMKDWYVVDGEKASILYYGFYASKAEKDGSKEERRAWNDKAKISAMTDSSGDRIFGQSLFVGLTSADPEAPAEWDLRNVKGKYWSLQIAAFKERSDRKQLAVDFVKELRASGKEAYYFHGETTSSVCIGAWDESAIEQQESDKAHSTNPNDDIVVAGPGVPLDGVGASVRTRDGHNADVQVPVIVPKDETMIAAMREFPYNAVNGTTGYKDKVTQKERFNESFLVVIPAAKYSQAGGSNRVNQLPDNPDDYNPVQNFIRQGAKTNKPRGGTLRSLDN